ncbi:MAG: NAD(P)-dependent oxidoreductase [Thermoanaerobaculia bacterium]|jgi:UDP-glucose 4-epimerase
MSSTEQHVGITGASGVLGRALVQSRDVAWHAFPGDIRSGAQLSDWLDGCPPLDAVFHLAAVVPTARVEREPKSAFDVNAGGTASLLEALRLRNASPWIFLASTSHVYEAAMHPLDEDSPLRASSLYGASKLAAEEWARAVSRNGAMRLCIGRIFSYSAAVQDDSYVIPSLVTRIRNAPPGGRLEVAGFGSVRDFLAASDVAAAIRRLHETRSEGVFNIGSGNGCSIGELARRLTEKLGRGDLRLEPIGTQASTIVADVGKIGQIGWHPTRSLDDLLDEVIAAHES